MARRVLEADNLKREGIVIPPLGVPKDVTVLKEIPIHKTFRGVYSLQFNFSGDILAVGFGAGGIQLYESATGKMMKELRSSRHGGHTVMKLAFHPKQLNLLYAATTEGVIHIINVDTEEHVGTIEEHGNEIFTFDFCVDGFNFTTGGRDLGVRVYETKTNKLVQHYEGYSQTKKSYDKNLVNNTMRIFCIKFHPDNQYIFVSGGWDNHLKIWDTRANDGIKRNILGPHICGDAIDIKENTLLSGQWTALHALQEYNYTSGECVKEYHYPHDDGAFLYCAQYCNDDLVVAGGSGTNRAELVQVSTNQHVAGFHLGYPIQAIDSSKNGRILAVGGTGTSFYILRVNDGTEKKSSK